MFDSKTRISVGTSIAVFTPKFWFVTIVFLILMIVMRSDPQMRVSDVSSLWASPAGYSAPFSQERETRQERTKLILRVPI